MLLAEKKNIKTDIWGFLAVATARSPSFYFGSVFSYLREGESARERQRDKYWRQREKEGRGGGKRERGRERTRVSVRVREEEEERERQTERERPGEATDGGQGCRCYF